MACCLTAPSHYLYQCWLIFSAVLCQFHRECSRYLPLLKVWKLRIWNCKNPSSRSQWVKHISKSFRLLMILRRVCWSAFFSKWRIIRRCNTSTVSWTNEYRISWWRHPLETFSALLAICARNSPVTGEFPAKRPVTQSFDVSLICAWINGWINNREAGDLRRHRTHYGVTVMLFELNDQWNPQEDVYHD